ncbi:MAG: hypothetical protein K0S07_1549 [Chlamydiales bacterium]|jgi:hypothetical protein|nr:hypothetical protein [Chlamydiales bacterium]
MPSKNIGTPDRLFRLGLAIALTAYAFFQGSLIALGFALFTYYEVFASWCVIYQLLGKNSCPLR